MNIRIETTKKEIEHREIKLPFYFKHQYSSIPSTYYAIFSEEHAMCISQYMKEIKCGGAAIFADNIANENTVEVTENEFTEVFDITIQQLVSMASH